MAPSPLVLTNRLSTALLRASSVFLAALFKGNTDSLKVYLNDHQQLVDNGDGTFSLVATNPDTDPDQPEIPGKPTTPEAPKPNAPNTGSQGLFAAGGGIANVFGAVLVGILLALGGWAWFSSRRSRRDRKILSP